MFCLFLIVPRVGLCSVSFSLCCGLVCVLSLSHCAVGWFMFCLFLIVPWVGLCSVSLSHFAVVWPARWPITWFACLGSRTLRTSNQTSQVRKIVILSKISCNKVQKKPLIFLHKFLLGSLQFSRLPRTTEVCSQSRIIFRFFFFSNSHAH